MTEARDLLGLTNSEIADEIGCDPRVVTNAFTANRALRASGAIEIIRSIAHLGIIRRRWQNGVREIMAEVERVPTMASYLTPRTYPVAIVPRSEIASLANFLAAHLTSAMNVGARRKKLYEEKLKSALDLACSHMAVSAAIRYWATLAASGREDGYEAAWKTLQEWGFSGRLRPSHAQIRNPIILNRVTKA